MPYNPVLDGIRCTAVLMVMAFHASMPRMGGGYLGVDVFFVLSGFLITSILQGEIDRSGSIDVKRFYMRRLLRLAPALSLMLAAYLLMAPFAWPEIPFRTDLRDAGLAFFYLADYSSALAGIPVKLRHSWSLAVEEHFYLAWPLLLIILNRRLDRRQMMWTLAAMYVVFTAWRIYCDLQGSSGYTHSYYRFDTRLSGLVIGALLSLFLSSRAHLQISRSDLLALLALLIVAGCTWHYTVNSQAALIYGITAVELATVALIIIAMNAPTARTCAILSHPVPTYIGRMSYGMYLWHYPIFVYLWGHWPWYWILPVGGVLTFGLAVISYHTIEGFARDYWRLKSHRG